MKRYFVVLLSLSLLTSCSWHPLGIFGKNSKKQAQITAEFADLDKEKIQHDDDRLTHIGAFSAGTDLALSKVTNSEPAIDIAREVNQRVEELANKPDAKELQEVYKMINIMLTNHAAGQALLQDKDKQIYQLFAQIEETKEDERQEIAKAREQATKTAQEADNATAKLNKLKGNFGLNAIFFGISTLVKDLMWFIGIGGAVFIILRVFASANPIAGALFSIFEVGFSWIINCIKVIAPKALAVAGTVSREAYDASQKLLSKIVDSVEWIKKTEQTTGKPMTVHDLLDELEKSMDSTEKTQIDNVKKQLGYT